MSETFTLIQGKWVLEKHFGYNTDYLFILETYFLQCCFGMFTQLVLCSSFRAYVHKYINNIDGATWPALHYSNLVEWWKHSLSTHTHNKKKNRHLNGLTYDHSVRAVSLGVLLALAHTAGAGLCLVGAQRLPLTLQTVLVLQVVLHVWLEENRHHLSHHFRRQARNMQKETEFISRHGCVRISKKELD